MSELIPMGKILTDRNIGDDDPVIKTLVDDIPRVGQLVPILVLPTDSGYYELVDGLRRFYALKQLGMPKIQAVVAMTLAEAIANLEMAHLNPPDRIRRVWEIRQGLDDLIEKYNAQIRSRPRPINGRSVAQKAEKLRNQLIRALGGLNAVDKILYVYRAAERGDPIAIAKVAKIEETNSIKHPYTRGIFKHSGIRVGRPGFTGEITQPRRQLEFLENAARTLGTTTDAMWKLGPLRMEPEDMARLALDLRTTRFILSRIIRLLEEAAK